MIDKRIITGLAGVALLSVAACSTGSAPAATSPRSTAPSSNPAYPVTCVLVTGPVSPLTHKPTIAARITVKNNGSTALELPDMSRPDPTFLFSVSFLNSSGGVIDSYASWPPIPTYSDIQPGGSETFNDQTSNGYPVHDQGLTPPASCSATLIGA